MYLWHRNLSFGAVSKEIEVRCKVSDLGGKTSARHSRDIKGEPLLCRLLYPNINRESAHHSKAMKHSRQIL